MWEIDYICEMDMLDAGEFGASTVRKRGFLIAMDMTTGDLSYSEGRALLQKMFQDIQKLKIDPARFIDTVMQDDDPWVASELKRLQALPGLTKENSEWQGKFVELLSGKGLAWSQVQVPTPTLYSHVVMTVLNRTILTRTERQKETERETETEAETKTETETK